MLEAHCPKLFNPAGAYRDHINTTFSRSYLNSDSGLRETDSLIQYSS